MSKRIVILGGGITGLSAAYFLEKAGEKNIVVLDAAATPGGKAQTVYEDGFVVEAGPDSFVTTKPWMLQLVKELGMEEELMEPVTSQFSFLLNGRLVAPPAGLRMMVPADKQAFLQSSFFTEEGKQRILDEENIPAAAKTEDESFADFITRRFGSEMLEKYAAPLFTGVYSTPAEELSLLATFPGFREMEQKYGSLSKAAKAQTAAPSTQARSPFLSLKNGIQSFIDALLLKLENTKIQVNTKVQQVSYINNTFIIKTEGAAEIVADALVVALPAHAAAQVLKPVSKELSEELSKISYTSSSIVSLAFKAEEAPQLKQSTGFVSAGDNPFLLSAATFTSAKWTHRAPDGYSLIRCFLKTSEVTSEDIETVVQNLKTILQLEAKPVKQWVHSWHNVLPQYKLGHTALVQNIENLSKFFPGLQVVGAAYRGVGLPDCIREGKTAAENIHQL